MANLITEIFDKQAVIDNLNQLGELINSSLNAIVSAAPKLQSPIDYMTALKSVDEIEKENIKTAEAKKKALSDLDKLYQQADKAIQQYDNLADAEYQTQTNLLNQYKEMTKEQKQLIEIERTRNQTMQNSQKLLSAEAKTEAELRMQTQQLIKASQSLRLTNADENKVREQLIAKINANKEALKGMTNEVSKQKDNIGNYKSAWDAVVAGQMNVKQAMAETRNSLVGLEALVASGVQLTADQKKRYDELNATMGKLVDIQGDMSARAKALSNDYLGMQTALEGLKFGANALGAVQSATAMLGVENEELVKTIQKLQAVQTFANSVGEIQKSLNKDSALMVGLRVVKEKLLTAAIGEQTKAQLALNAAKLGFAGLLAGAVVGLGVWIAKMESAKSKNAELADEINKKASESIGNNIAKITELKSQWDKLGGTLEEKKAYFEKYKGVLEELGLKFGNITELETFMNEHTDDYVKAITARAKADAARIILAEKSQEYVKNQLDFERQNIKGLQTFREKFQRFILDFQVGRSEASKMMRQAFEAEQKSIVEETKSLTDLIDQYSKEADELFKSIGLHEQNTDATKQERQSKEEELTIEERLYLLRKKINEEREKQELPALAKVSVKMKEMADMTDILNDRLQSALHIIQYEYTKAVNEATTAEEKSKLAKEQQRKEIELQIEYSKRMLETLPPQTDEWYKLAKAIEDYRKQLGDLNKYEEPEWLTAAKKRVEATQEMVGEIANYNSIVSDFQLQRLQEQEYAYNEEYERQKEYINNTVLSEAEKNKKLEELDRKKTAHDKAVAKERAEIERRKAIFDASVQAASAIANAVGSVGKLLSTSAEGDPYSAIARYIAAIAAGASAVASVIALVSQMVSIPQYAKGGTAEANKPFIAGEKGREIGFGVYSGKMYDFSKPTLFKANEPINIKNATETKQIINNNTEYNKDVTLKNTIMVKVIDNARVVKYFKL